MLNRRIQRLLTQGRVLNQRCRYSLDVKPMLPKKSLRVAPLADDGVLRFLTGQLQPRASSKPADHRDTGRARGK